MKVFFKDLYNYYSSIERSGAMKDAKSTSVLRVLFTYAIFLIYVFIETFSFVVEIVDDGEPVVYFSGFYIIIVAPVLAVHIIFHTLKYKPSLCSLMPVNYKKRVLFDLILPVLICIIMFIILYVLLIIIAGFLVLFVPSSMEDASETVYTLGWLVVFFRFLFAYGFNIIIACQKKFANKIISGLLFIAVYFAATIVTGLAINGFDIGKGFTALYSEQFNNMAMPWLGYMLWAIAGIGTMIAAVFCVIKFEKPKEF